MPSTSAGTGSRGRRCPSRSSRCALAPRSPNRSTSLPPRARAEHDRRPCGRCRTRLHDVGPGRLARRAGRARGMGGATHVTLDAGALQVLIARLSGVADEVGAVLRRAASSPNIKERADCSAACFTAEGELLAQAEHIPVHLGSMPAAVRAAIEAVDDVAPGDQIVSNDPFAGGTHLNDVTLVAPVFVADELVAWVANRAHHADLGGMAPGSMPPDALDIAQEGLRVPPVRLTPEVEAVIVASSRTPDERRGDLAAQRGANVVGVGRLARSDRGARRCRTSRRGARLRRAQDADRAGGAPERSFHLRGRARLRRPAARAADGVAGDGRRDDRRRSRHVRLHGKRTAARRQRERGRGRDDQRGGVRDPRRDGREHPGERGSAPPGDRRRAVGHGRGRGAHPSPSARATSRSASVSRTSVSVRWLARCPTGSARPDRGR